jgi:type 1 glutamine amidotransferase
LDVRHSFFLIRQLCCTATTAVLFLAAVCFQAIVRADEPLRVAFLIGEDEYKTWDTLPEFAKQYLEPAGVKCDLIQEASGQPGHFSGLETIDTADELFVSVRRRPLPDADMARLHRFFDAGKPLVGIRTACHAFAARPGTEPAAGLAQWANFDTQMLGAHYLGHFTNTAGTEIRTADNAVANPILNGVAHRSFHSGGTLYKFEDVSPDATVLLTGETTDQGLEVKMPVAWTFQAGKSRVFYTSLGHPDDFKLADFNRMLVNAVFWAAGRTAPEAK